MTKKDTAIWLRVIAIAAFMLLAFAGLLTQARAEEAAYAVTFDDNGGMHDVGPEAGEVKVYSAENYPGVSITATSAAGVEYADGDGDGVLMLPDGTYEFHIACQFNHIVGDVTVDGAAQTVSVGMWDFNDWLDVEGLRLSLGQGPDNTTLVPNFEQGEIDVEKGEHSFRVDVPDNGSNLFIYMNYSSAVFSTEEAAAKQPKALKSFIRKDNGEQGGYDGRITDPNDRTWWAKQHSWDSLYNSFGYMFLESNSVEGNTGTIRVFLVGDVPTYFRYQDYTLQVDRIPTLSALRTAAVGGSALTAVESFSVKKWAMVYNYEYRTPGSVKQVVVTPTPLNADYQVTVNGQMLTDGSATVDMELDESGNTLPTAATVTVSAGGYSKDYTVTFTPMEPKRITFNAAQPGTTVQVFNKDGDEMYPASSRLGDDGRWSYLYLLTEGETYTYVATGGEYYHSTKDFTMEESANKTFNIRVIDDEHWLEGLSFLKGYWGDGRLHDWLLEPIPVFETETHAYDLLIRDCDNAVHFTADYDEINLDAFLYISGPGIMERYRDIEADMDGARYGDYRDKFQFTAINHSAAGGCVALRFSKTVDGVRYYQDYNLNFTRFCTLKTLSVSCGDTALALDHEYVGGDLEFTVKAPFNAETITVYAPNNYPDEEGRYVKVNGVTTVDDRVEVPMNGSTETETVYIEVGSTLYPEATRTITLTVLKTQPVSTEISYEPAQAVLTIRNNETTERIWPDAEGRWKLNDGYSYTYTLTAPGYAGRRNTITVTTDDKGETFLVMDGDRDHPVKAAEVEGRLTAELSLRISAAPENTALDHTMEAEWADFRGTSYTWDEASGKLAPDGTAYTNNGIVSAPTPVDAADSTLYWASKIGEGFSTKAVSSPILVDGDLIVYAGDWLFRVDPFTGAIKTQKQMTTTSAFNINPPFYYDGMIFVALSHGKIQAFDAATLESLWIYTDPEGGQPNSNITIYDGYLYTGFWNNEDVDANFVCLTVTDEDPTRGDEAKIATWTHLQKGGFYWAGAYVCDDFLLVGTDDGKSGYMTMTEFNWSSELLLLDRHTGAVLDKRSGLKSDIRCGITYDASTDAYYFTSKGGCFYQARVTKEEGGAWRISELNALDLDNFNLIKTSPPMSTSTPVVYNGRAYIGVSGVGQFNQYNGHNITVIDLENWCIAYKVPTQGYPQTSGLLTTAYEYAGCVYVYFFDNYTPGTLRMLRDRPGQTAPDPVTVEYYSQHGTVKTYDTPYVLFTPVGEQAQFAICSPICDRYGVMYFKNDSGYLMAFGPAIEKLEVTKPPKRTAYDVGDTFDPAGMVVTLTYVNGMTRDVSDHVLWSAEPLEEGDTEITLRYPSLYHNMDNADGTTGIGMPSDTVFTTVTIRVGDQRGIEYKINSIELKDSAGQSLSAIPRGKFSAEISVTNLTATTTDTLVLASYDKNGRFLGVISQDVVSKSGETVRLEAKLDNTGGEIAKLKAFVTTKDDAAPLAAAVQLGK